MPRTPAAVAAAASIALLLPLAGPASAAPAPLSDRQQAYDSAAAEFGVPAEVLLGVSYMESQWNTYGGTPSVAAGYGPMHLTDFATATASASAPSAEFDGEDARGDDSRPLPQHTVPAPAGVPAAALQTAQQAAQLAGTTTAAVRGDVRQNIRAGAALLASYQQQHSANTGDWYAAVAKYSGATDSRSAADFADEVFQTIRQGVTRTTDDGQLVTLRADASVKPNTAQLAGLHLTPTDSTGVECPRGLSCELDPAAYAQYGPTPDDYGNHDTSDRPASQKIDYIVIHDTEATWDTTLNLIQDPKYVSWNYTIRSQDGHIAQHVLAKDVAWHAANWYINTRSIGIEHEGFLAQSGWYTEAMYRASATLVRYLAAKYQIPLDRQHILGHDNVPGITPPFIPTQHTDPGPYWDWDHYFTLLGAPQPVPLPAPPFGMLTIHPDMATNNVPFTGCVTRGTPCPARGSSEVVLHSQPSDTSPLLTDLGLHPNGAPQTMDVNDVGSRVSEGQQYAIADRKGGWIAIWYLGQKGWFHAKDAVFAAGLVVTPKPGKASVPIYGRAYPEASAYPPGTTPQAIVPQPYTLDAGQSYVYGGLAPSQYLATVYDPTGTVNTKPVNGKTRYYEIQYGHRVEFVNADDVQLKPAL
ncbi:N-acetylmuramoyl-L-alanine amidase [Kutzneria sp. NPDC052558]|uniref:N-acetylmuramoyl-L-alanine amidase n=1 Tax=Kutzneria sp. NPDC052558 TaxID=3364121 RepID=UPI0037C7C84F